MHLLAIRDPRRAADSNMLTDLSSRYVLCSNTWWDVTWLRVLQFTVNKLDWCAAAWSAELVKATLLGPTSIGHSRLPPCLPTNWLAGMCLLWGMMVASSWRHQLFLLCVVFPIRILRLFDSHPYRSISAARSNDLREFSQRSRSQNTNTLKQWKQKESEKERENKDDTAKGQKTLG